ncbi:hypothetical protein PMAYCL1PPCAC_24833, partial [Pristionchus mayeri]
FCEWENVLDEQKGFIRDGKLIIEGRFTLSNLIGIRCDSHVDFSDPEVPFHDVEFVIGGEKIYASKQILAIHSPVFKEMFYGENADNNKGEIELNDVEKEEFIDILYLIYPSCKKITDANAESLLKIADRFQIKTIIDRIEQFLMDSTKWNFPAKLNLSEKYTLVELQEFCLDTFESAEEIMNLKRIDGYEELSNNVNAALLRKAMKLPLTKT